MFKFSDYENMHVEAQQKADELLDGLKKEFKLKHSPQIDNLLTTGEVNSFKALEGISEIFKTENQSLRLVVCPYFEKLAFAIEDIEVRLEQLGMSKSTSTIPYVAWSFPEDYDNPHGSEYQHVFFFFITKYKEFEEAEECISYFVDKFNRIGAFV